MKRIPYKGSVFLFVRMEVNMGITIINETQESFVVVNKNILTDKSLNMRDRGMLTTLMSLPPTWEFSAKGMAAILPDGIDGVTAALKSLEAKGYITRERIKDAQGRFAGTNLTIHTIPQLGKPTMENTDMDHPETENPRKVIPIQLNTQKVITKGVTNKESIIQLAESFSADEFSEMIINVKQQIDYDAAIIDRPYDRMMIDAIVNLITEVLLSNKSSIRIMKEDYPIQVVKERFKRVTMSNVIYVVDSFKREKNPITDLKAYLLTCLYNAPAYEDMYWKNIVNSTL